jgi:phosphoribosylamine---glycine ligase
MNLVMPTRILILGRGGREHALAWKLASEPGVNRVVVAPGSAGIATEARVVVRPDVDPLDLGAVVALARAEAVELAVVGPEQPLAAGVADALVAVGVPTFGPSAAAARIETSKAFCHEVGEAAGVRMAASVVARMPAEAEAAIGRLVAGGRGFVVKADGLAGGKGVAVFEPGATAADADDLVSSLFRAGERVVIEERLEGREASLIALADGRRAVPLPFARDHKRLLDGDQGPNTGGMGAFSPLPDLPDDEADALVAAIHAPILAELARRGTPFRGALYAGLMLTRGGPVLLECNARFGDPETQVVLPRLAGPLGPLLLAAARGSLPEGASIPAIPGAAVGIVLATGPYPETGGRGEPIEGLDGAREAGALVFHAGTRLAAGTWETDGGRVLSVVGRGPDLATARDAAEGAADAITWPGMRRRHDIAADFTAAVAVGAAT